MAKAGATINPKDFYPEVKKHRGKSRDLPMNDFALRNALENYLSIRLSISPQVKKTEPLFMQRQLSCPVRIASVKNQTHRQIVSPGLLCV